MTKLSLFKQSSIIASGYFMLVEKTVVYIIHRKYMVFGNTRFISRVEHVISHSLAALTREICSKLEIIWYFRTHTHVLFSI